MQRKVVAAAGGVVVVLVGGLVAALAPQTTPSMSSCDAQLAAVSVDMTKLPKNAVAGYSTAQLLTAAKIMAAGKAAGVSYRDQVIGIAVGMGESDLSADPTSKQPNGDQDVGLFQQRALPGWYADGQTETDNVARLNNDDYAAKTFFLGHDVKVAAPGGAGPVGFHLPGLVDIKNRDSKAPSAVGHEVQGNADPNHYAKWWDRAQEVAKAVAGASDAPAASAPAEPGQCSIGAGVPADSGKTGKDTYGPMWSSKGHIEGVDPWSFYWGECVSYAAWMVRTTSPYPDFVNNWHGAHFGNAKEWAAAAREVGITVDSTPAVGAIAQHSRGRNGHVAYITTVNTDGSFEINEYNHAGHHIFSSRKVRMGTDFDNVLHFEQKGKR